MELGMVGLGRMGGNMAARLIRGGHRVFVFDAASGAVKAAVKNGATGAHSLAELVSQLADSPRTVWVMVPAGEPAESTIETLSTLLSPGDILVDGGNSNYKDSVRRALALATKGIFFLDVGTSGGVWGLKEGYCFMVGGDKNAYRRLEPIFKTLAAQEVGYGYMGPSGSGHFVKMVHNGVEYALMEAYAEGFELIEAKKEFKLDLHQIANVWRYGSVVRSWLLDLTALALVEDPDLRGIASYVEDTGEGRWTVAESLELAVPIPAITASLQVRFRSRQETPFSGKLLAALRKQFGGHAVKKGKRITGA